MDTGALKKLLAGMSIASILALGITVSDCSGIGCG